jgi:C-terminal processing protease CtpA/Prc
MVVVGSSRMRPGLSHGIGLAIERDARNNCVVSRVLPGGAAAFSGQVHKGDIIMKIDNYPTANMSEDDVPQWFLGEAGTVVELTLQTGSYSGRPRNVRLVRQPISMLSHAEEDQGPELAGIGAVLASDVNGNLVVSRLVYGGAAAFTKPNDLFGEDRLKKQDQIVAIDGRDVRGLQPVDVRPLLLGPIGSNVALMVKRAKYDVPVEIVLRRRADSMQTQFVPMESSNAYPVIQEVPAARRPSPRASRVLARSSLSPRRLSPSPGRDMQSPRATRNSRKTPITTTTTVQAPAPAPLKVGVGLVLKERSDGCHVIKRLKPGQAAEHCGQIEEGDRLTHVDSLDIERGVASAFLADLIAGPQGSVVNLTFEKHDGSRVSINLLRGNAEYIAEVLRQEKAAQRASPRALPGQQSVQYHPPALDEHSSAKGRIPAMSGRGRSTTPTRGPGLGEDPVVQAVGVSLSLDEDYDALVTSPERLQAFNIHFKTDVAAAVGASVGRIQLVGLQRSEGIIVDLNIFPDAADDRTPKQLAAELAAQVADPRSLLRNSASTRRVNRADVHVGHVAPPPHAAVVKTSNDAVPSMQRQSPPTRAPPPPEMNGGSPEGAGVGLVLREVEGQHIVRRVVPQSAADRCGVIHVGDVLLSVDGRTVRGSQVQGLIPGAHGSTVNLHFRRHGGGRNGEGLRQQEYKVALVRGFPASPRAHPAPELLSSPRSPRQPGVSKRAASPQPGSPRLVRGHAPPSPRRPASPTLLMHKLEQRGAHLPRAPPGATGVGPMPKMNNDINITGGMPSAPRPTDAAEPDPDAGPGAPQSFGGRQVCPLAD